jgi:dTDP-4-dehydrorhamnose reductase
MSARPVILVTGCNGQLGTELQRALALFGSVVAVDRQRCDLAHAEAIRHCVRTLAPDVIVNAGAYTAVDRAETERDLAFAINAGAPQVLAEEAERSGAALVHYSTDYVFDGSGSGRYRESDPTGPLGVYGESKLAGEQAVAAVGGRAWVLRTSWVFGLHGNNFLKTMLRLARQRDSLAVVADQTGAPTSAGLIADVTALLVRALAAPGGLPLPPPGLYHLAAGGETSWHGYARHVIARARLGGMQTRVAPGDIRAIATPEYPTPARRPANSRLDCRKLEAAFGVVLPDWKADVERIVDQLVECQG